MIKQKMSDIQQFLDCKRIAIVGMSRDPGELSRMIWKPLLENGMEIFPVHHEAESIDGIKCYKSVLDISPVPEAALIMVNKEKYRLIVDECIAAGIKNVWLYGVTGPKSIDDDLQSYGIEKGLNLVAGYCPYMFLDNVEKGHKVHAFIWKLIGLYPKKK